MRIPRCRSRLREDIVHYMECSDTQTSPFTVKGPGGDRVCFCYKFIDYILIHLSRKRVKVSYVSFIVSHRKKLVSTIWSILVRCGDSVITVSGSAHREWSYITEDLVTRAWQLHPNFSNAKTFCYKEVHLCNRGDSAGNFTQEWLGICFIGENGTNIFQNQTSAAHVANMKFSSVTNLYQVSLCLSLLLTIVIRFTVPKHPHTLIVQGRPMLTEWFIL